MAQEKEVSCPSSRLMGVIIYVRVKGNWKSQGKFWENFLPLLLSSFHSHYTLPKQEYAICIPDLIFNV